MLAGVAIQSNDRLDSLRRYVPARAEAKGWLHRVETGPAPERASRSGRSCDKVADTGKLQRTADAGKSTLGIVG
jgi:hypothetical protein